MAGQRQIPQSKEYLCNPLYWDIVYGYIQSNSEWDSVPGHPRILPKNKVNFTKIGRYLGVTRQTVSKRFSDLENGQKNKQGLNLIKKLDNGDYEIAILDNEIATLVDNDTLRVLTSALNNHTISIYVYLYSRWKAGQEKDFIFTYEQLKKVVGIGDKSTSTNYIVKDIINVLILMELLEIKVETELSPEGGYKTFFKVINMSDTVTDKVAELLEDERVKKIK